MQDVAASWLMTHLSSSPLVISLLSFSASLPVVFLSIPAGLWADQGHRRQILLLAQALMFCSATLLGVQAVSGNLSATTILILSFSMGVGVALNGPAYQMVLSELVPPQEQQSAVLLYYMGLNITRVLGPALGGFVLGMLGPSAAFFVNAVSFSGLILYYWRWPLPAAAGSSEASSSRRILVKDWLWIFSRSNWLFWGEIFVVSFAAAALWALYPVRGRLELHLESLQYGSLLGCLGLGAFLSAMFSKRVLNPARTWQSLSFAYLVFAGGEVVLAGADHYYWACLAMLLAGIGWIILATLMNMSTRQLATAPHLRATMLGGFLAVFYLGMSLGSVSWGGIAKHSGTTTALLSSAAILAVSAALKFIRKK